MCRSTVASADGDPYTRTEIGGVEVMAGLSMVSSHQPPSSEDSNEASSQYDDSATATAATAARRGASIAADDAQRCALVIPAIRVQCAMHEPSLHTTSQPEPFGVLRWPVPVKFAFVKLCAWQPDPCNTYCFMAESITEGCFD